MGQMLKTFARMLRIAPRYAEDALHSDGQAKAVLSRREFGMVAMATGAAFAFPTVIEAPRLTSELQFSLYGEDLKEITYASYARLAATKADFAVEDGRIENATELWFPRCTGGHAVVCGVNIHDHRGRLKLSVPLSQRVVAGSGIQIGFRPSHLILKQIGKPFATNSPEAAFDELVANAERVAQSIE